MCFELMKHAFTGIRNELYKREYTAYYHHVLRLRIAEPIDRLTIINLTLHQINCISLHAGCIIFYPEKLIFPSFKQTNIST